MSASTMSASIMPASTLPAANAARPVASFASDDERWEAVRRRDPGAIGAFVHGVVTTGVYCRPSCPARLPRRENVRFHATCADARAGRFPALQTLPARSIPGMTMTAHQPGAAAGADVAARVAALDWTGIAASLDAHGCATTGALLTPPECAALECAYARGAALPQPRHHGPARLRPRGIPILRLSAAGADRGAAHRALSAARRDRQPLERGDGHGGALSAIPPGVPRALSPGRTEQADAAAAAIPRRGLQLPAPGYLRRARVPAADHLAAVAAGCRLHRRRVRAHRAAPAHAVARRGGAAGAGRGRDLPGAPSSGARHPRHLPGQHAPRREPAARGRAAFTRRGSYFRRPGPGTSTEPRALGGIEGDSSHADLAIPAAPSRPLPADRGRGRRPERRYRLGGAGRRVQRQGRRGRSEPATGRRRERPQRQPMAAKPVPPPCGQGPGC